MHRVVGDYRLVNGDSVYLLPWENGGMNVVLPVTDALTAGDDMHINIFSHMNTILKDRVRNAMTQSRDCDHLLQFPDFWNFKIYNC